MIRLKEPLITIEKLWQYQDKFQKAAKRRRINNKWMRRTERENYKTWKKLPKAQRVGGYPRYFAGCKNLR